MLTAIVIATVPAADDPVSVRVAGMAPCGRGPDGPKCLVIRVFGPGRDGHPTRFELVCDERLPVRVADALGPAAPEGLRAIVDMFGRILRRRPGRADSRTAALWALSRLEEAGVVRYHDRQEGVVVPEALEARLEAVARALFRATGRRLLVTSGTRSAERQAAAMYVKARLGSNLRRVYRSDLAAPIVRAYRRGRKNKATKAEIVAEMAAVIEAQMARGLYISRHLRAGAIDVRSRGLSRNERQALRAAIRADGGIRLLEEGRPPHFHLEFR